MPETMMASSLDQITDLENVSLSLDGDSSQYPLGRIEPSPCMRACPAGVNVKAYVSLIASGKFKEALAVVRERNPLPGICGRVCTHPCESYCNRAEIDAPVAICALKRFVADYELKHPAPVAATPRTRNERIAIVGSGPAGLAAAHDLIRRGFGVTVFEALPKAGGMLVAGIPAFRLPRNIIQYEIEVIKRLGVEFQTGMRVAGEGALDQLFEEGYSAVFLAIGAHRSKKLGIRGEEQYEGIIDSITFLREANLGRLRKPGERVAVIGGGNSAIDASRTAIRMGCAEVTIVYRRTRNEMPASPEEVEQAENEGVSIHFLAAPVQLLENNGRLAGMICTEMKLGEPDNSGRRRPVPIKGAHFWMPVDGLITAISQTPDLSFLPKQHGLALSRWNTLAVDELTLATSRAGVFAGGDATTGPNTVIDAIAAGHRAAQSIERYLNQELMESIIEADLEVEMEIKWDGAAKRKRARTRMPTLVGRDRVSSFREVERGFSAALAVKEAQRCLRCGPCRECSVCVPECGKVTKVLSTADGRSDLLLRMPAGFDEKHTLVMATTGVLRGPNTTIPVLIEPTSCYVDPESCRGCGDCVELCAYSAPMLLPKQGDLYVSMINEAICKGCGTCVGICPSSAIVQSHFSSTWLEDHLQKIDRNKKSIVVFTCNWNDTSVNSSALSSVCVDNVDLLLIRAMCCGRIEPSFVLRAFEFGASGVLVVGCPTNSCHYGFGNKRADEHFGAVQNMLHLLGYSPERFQWAWPTQDRNSGFGELIKWFVRSIQKEAVCELSLQDFSYN